MEQKVTLSPLSLCQAAQRDRRCFRRHVGNYTSDLASPCCKRRVNRTHPLLTDPPSIATGRRQFLTRCANLIDDGKLEEMLELFDEKAKYQVLPLENLKQGLPSSLMRCSSRNMLRDHRGNVQTGREGGRRRRHGTHR